jgi:hypothetical protein
MQCPNCASAIAATLKVKQPSISKIERQTDMYLSTLRRYVEAIGGELDLVVRLPSRRVMRLHRLGEVLSGSAKPAPQRSVGRSSSAKKAPQACGQNGLTRRLGLRRGDPPARHLWS